MFTRPIYAGNAIATVRAKADIKLKVITVRGTAFTPLSSQAEHEVVDRLVRIRWGKNRLHCTNVPSADQMGEEP